MKRTRKIISYFLLSLLSVLIILIVVAALSENKIARLAINQMEAITDIPVKVNTVEFSLIRNFPLATIQCNQLTVYEPANSGSSPKDTLIYAKKVFLSVNVRELFSGFFDVRKVEVSSSQLFYKVDTAGNSNIDFLLQDSVVNEPQAESADQSLNIDLRSLEFSDLNCIYTDQRQQVSARINVDELKLSGRINDTEYLGQAELKAVVSDLNYPGTNAHLLKELSLQGKGSFEDDSLNIEQGELNFDDFAKIAIKGNVILADTLHGKLLFNAEKLDVGALMKFVPDSLLEEYGIREIDGILASQINIDGKFSADEQPEIDATFTLSDGSIRYQNYPEIRKLVFQGEINNGTNRTPASTSVTIQNLAFQTDSSTFKLNGHVRNLDRPTFNIQAKSTINLKEASLFIPDSLVQELSGKIQADFSTFGVLPDSITEAFIQTMLNNSKGKIQLQNVDAKMDSTLAVSRLNGTINYQSEQIDLKEINGSAFVQMLQLRKFELDAQVFGNPLIMDSLRVKVDHLLAKLDSSEIQLNGEVRNLSKPDYQVEGDVNVDLAEFKDFVPDSLFQSVSGQVHSHFQSAATLNLDSLSDQVMDIAMAKSSFNLELQNISVQATDSLMNVEHVSGNLSYKNDTFKIGKLAAKYLGMTAEMQNVTATNVYAGALQNKALEIKVNGDFYVDNVDYDQLGVLMETTTEASEDTAGDTAKYTYKINGKVRLDRLKYEGAVLENINSRFLVKDGYYVLDSMTMNGFQGSALTSAKIEMQGDDLITLWFKTDVKRMDATELLQTFGDYVDYEYIKAENMRGKVSAVLDGKIVLKNFETDYNELLLKGDLTLENGALFNVQPVMEIESIPAVGIKNLDSLYFSTLNSQLFLFRNDVYIPKTEIRTSSFDAMMLGMYSFGEDYAYHIRLFLGEVLSSKSKANLRKQAEEGGFTEEDEKDVTKGRTSIYVVSKLENGKEKAGFDNKKDRSNMVARVNLQKQMLDMRFHPTLVNYKTDE